MPKSRKKKVKHQDFAKVKLKVGKKLPRAANETVPSFRSRSIQIKDQFKSGTEGNEQLLINRKKINIKDILSQCQHYNPGNKHEALKKLLEAVSSSAEVVDNNLVDIVERCSELFVDKDHVVRANVYRLFRLIFARVPLSCMTPLFPIINAYLCCAMTHLDEEIQLDSLKILDIILDCYPELVVASSSQLLPNLLEQISKEQAAGGFAGKKEQDIRLLSVNPNGIMGSTRWRNDVLRRLKRVLEAVVNHCQDGLTTKMCDTEDNEIKWSATKRLVKSHQYPAWNVHNAVIQSPGVTAVSGMALLSNGQSLKSYLQSLIPLLLQCWVEVGPAQLTTNLPGNFLSQSSLLILANVLAILELIMKYIIFYLDDSSFTVDWIKHSYMKDFTHYLTEHFPFCKQERKQTPKKHTLLSEDEQKVSSLSLNLDICQVMSYLLDTNSLNEKWFQRIVVYMTEDLEHCNLSSDELKLSLRVYDRLLQTIPDNKIRENLLRPVLNMLKSKNTKSADLQLMLNFFIKVFFRGRNEDMKSLQVFRSWINLLPRLFGNLSHLTEPVITLTLRAVKYALIQNQCIFNVDILDTWKLLDVTFVEKLTNEQQRLLVEIVFGVPLKRPHFKQLAFLYTTNKLDQEVQCYLLHILSNRICSEDVNEELISNYFSFVFTQLLDPTSVGSIMFHEPSANTHKSIISIDCSPHADELWQEKYMKLQCVLEELHSLSLPEHIITSAWITFLTQLLADAQSVSVTSAVALLLSTSVLLHDDLDIPSDVMNFLIELIYGCMSFVAKLLTSSTITVDFCNTVVSEQLPRATLHACLHCILAVKDLWMCYLGHVMSIIEKESSSFEKISQTVAGVCQLSTNEVLKDKVKIYAKKLMEVMTCIKVICPEITSTCYFGNITYYLSVLEK